VQHPLLPDTDDVDQVARPQVRHLDLDPHAGQRRDLDHLGLAHRAFSHEQSPSVGLDDRPAYPPDIRPDPVGYPGDT
jgi:hypothetical protein